MTASDVNDILSQVLLIRGLPKFIRSADGPEFIGRAVRDYQEKADVGTLYIAPGGPWENGYPESFFSRLRDELLDGNLFADMREAQVLAAAWQSEYNHRRPHSASGNRAPAGFAAMCAQADATPRSMAAAAVRRCEQSITAHGQPPAAAAAALGAPPQTPQGALPLGTGL